MEPGSSLPYFTEQAEASPPPHILFLYDQFLIVYCHPCLGLRNGIFPSGRPTKITYDLLIATMPATCPAQLIFDQLRW
jgi:hypothetical protein